MESPPIIELRDIKINKGNRSILDIGLLSLSPGETLGIAGPNGAGKSTLVKVMSLLEEPGQGTIFIRGKKVWPGKIDLSVRRQMAVMFQQPLMLSTSVYNNVALPLKLRRVSRKEIRPQVMKWLERFGIAHLADRSARSLSGGEQQRVNMARTMISDPRVLFMDEPFTALDLPTKKSLLTDFKQILSETGTTTVIVSHDYQEIRFLCQSMVIMGEGKIHKKTDTKNVDLSELPEYLSVFMKDWLSPLDQT